MSKNYVKSMPILMRLVEYSIKCIRNERLRLYIVFVFGETAGNGYQAN